MSNQNKATLISLYTLIDNYFNLEEIRSLCFQIGVDYESLGGEGKSARIRELILHCSRQNKLAKLHEQLQQQRPFVDWPLITVNMTIPTDLETEWSAATQQTIVHGDVIHGDKFGGDKVEGNKISLDNINLGQGFYTEHRDKAKVHIHPNSPDDELAPLFASLLLQVAQQAPTSQKAEAIAKVNQLKTEVENGISANDEIVAGLLQDIYDIIPTVAKEMMLLFTNPIIAQSAGPTTDFVLKRFNR